MAPLTFEVVGVNVVAMFAEAAFFLALNLVRGEYFFKKITGVHYILEDAVRSVRISSCIRI